MAARVFRNFSFLSVSKIASDAFTFLLFVVFSRVFGQEGIGQYSYAMALTGFFALFGEFGLTNLSIKQLARPDESVPAFLGRVLALRIVFSALSFAVLLLVLPWLSATPEAGWVVVLLAIYQYAYKIANGFTAVLVAKERMGLVALLEFSLRVAVALVGVAIALAGGPLWLAVGVLPLMASAEAAAAAVLVSRRYGAPKLSGAFRALPETVRTAFPYGLSSLMFQLQSRVDVVLLGLLIGVTASGVYNVAYRVVFLLSFVSYYAGVAIMPAASRLFVDSREELRDLYRDALRVVVLVAVPASAGLALMAPDLIGLVFGEPFAESAGVLQLLAWVLALGALKNVTAIFLMACDRQVHRVKSQGIVAVANVLGNLALIPLFGVKGAVVSTLAAESLLVGLQIWGLRDVLGWPPIASRLAISVAASAAFCAPVLWLGPLPIFAMIPAAMVIYAVALVAFRDVRESEVRIALSWLRGATSG